MSVSSVLLEDIFDYVQPQVAVLKIDAEGKDCKVSFCPKFDNFTESPKNWIKSVSWRYSCDEEF